MNHTAFVLVLYIFSLFGCSPTVVINKEFQDSSFLSGTIQKGSTINIFVSGNINVNQCGDEYMKEFHSNPQFISMLSNRIADSMKAIAGCGCKTADNIDEAMLLISTKYDTPSIDRIQSLFSSATEDYFVVIRSVDFSKYSDYSQGGGYFESSGVSMKVDMWQVKAKKKVLSFSTQGFSGTELNGAVGIAVQNIANYLAKGTTTSY